MNKKLLQPLVLIIATTSAVILSNWFWIAQNTQSPYFDTAGHTILSFILGRVFSGDYPFNGVIPLLQQSNYYPPLMYVFGALISNLFGFNYKILQIVASSLLLPLTISTFLLAKKLSRSDWIATTSAILLVLFPHIWEQSRYWMLDLPLTLWIVLFWYFLYTSNSFRKFPESVLCILFAAFAQLTKWYGFIFMLIPLISVIYSNFRDTSYRTAFIYRSIWLATFGAILVLPWYLANAQQLVVDTFFFSHAHYQNPTSTWSVQNFLYYPTLLLNFQIVSVLFVWLVISFILVTYYKPQFIKTIVIHVLFSLFVLTLLGNKNVRFSMPLLPFFAIIMGTGVNYIKLKSKLTGLALLVFLILFGFGFMLSNSFKLPFNTNKMISIAPVSNWDIFIFYDGTSNIIPYRIPNTSWSAKHILIDIEKQSDIPNPKVYVGINDQYLSQPIIEVFKFEKNSAVTFSTPPFDTRTPINTSAIAEEYLKQFDYYLIPRNTVGPRHHVNYQNLEFIRTFMLSDIKRQYAWLDTYRLPSGEEVYLFQRKPGFNTLEVNISNDGLFLKRQDSPTKVFLQLYDAVQNTWDQQYMAEHQIDLYQNLQDIQRVRIDYPPEILNLVVLDGWTYDGDKQFDRIQTPLP